MTLGFALFGTMLLIGLAMIVMGIVGLLNRPQRHFESDWDGTHAKCLCGYHDAQDWDLSKHFAELEQARTADSGS